MFTKLFKTISSIFKPRRSANQKAPEAPKGPESAEKKEAPKYKLYTEEQIKKIVDIAKKNMFWWSQKFSPSSDMYQDYIALVNVMHEYDWIVKNADIFDDLKAAKKAKHAVAAAMGAAILRLSNTNPGEKLSGKVPMPPNYMTGSMTVRYLKKHPLILPKPSSPRDPIDNKKK